MSPIRRMLVPLVLPAVLALSACGSDGTTTASPTTTAGAGGGENVQGFRGGEDFQEIQECLTAAGITLPTPSGGFRGTPPSGGPQGTPPSGAPRGTPPSGAPGDDGPGGGFGGMFSDPDVQAALKACGITVPTGRPDGSRPSATSTA
jgi:hypothetical protein